MPVLLEPHHRHALDARRLPRPQTASLDHLLALDERAENVAVRRAQRDHRIVEVERVGRRRPHRCDVVIHDLGRSPVVSLVRMNGRAIVGERSQ